MTRQALFQHILAKKSFLCIGLDTDISKIPSHLLKYKDPIFEFNKQIIEATQDLCVSYKPNLAFYEAHGSKGWKSLEKSIKLISSNHFIIADAKRGDIGNTSQLYAKAFFEEMNVDAVTVAPYMGEDSVTPFLGFKEKWVILLALTSNAGSKDFQMNTQTDSNNPLYADVLQKAQTWASPEEMMFVIGATHPEKFAEIRQLAKEYFFLVPGVGAQGGDLEKVTQNGKNDHCGLLINSSRGIIYAGNGKDFAQKARAAALEVQQQMAQLLDGEMAK